MCQCPYTDGMTETTLPQSHTPRGFAYVTVAGGIARPCKRCAGFRNVDAWRHVEGGQCFRCQGQGAEAKRFPTVEAFEAHEVKRVNAQARRQAKREQAFAQELPEVTPEPEVETVTWSHLVAEIGDTVTVTGVVAVAVSVDTRFGTSRLVVVETPANEAVKMFTTANWAWDVEAGQTLTITGTVKSYESYQGQPQTMLSRPQVVAA